MASTAPGVVAPWSMVASALAAEVASTADGLAAGIGRGTALLGPAEVAESSVAATGEAGVGEAGVGEAEDDEAEDDEAEDDEAEDDEAEDGAAGTEEVPLAAAEWILPTRIWAGSSAVTTTPNGLPHCLHLG
ncbi:MAG: hypothetical protein ACO1RT_09755 [Planctomycetaceae bacterium]